MTPDVTVVVPADVDAPTGGNIYDRRVSAALSEHIGALIFFRIFPLRERHGKAGEMFVRKTRINRLQAVKAANHQTSANQQYEGGGDFYHDQ